MIHRRSRSQRENLHPCTALCDKQDFSARGKGLGGWQAARLICFSVCKKKTETTPQKAGWHPEWKSRLWREERLSKLGFLLKSPSRVEPWWVSSNSGYPMTSPMVEQPLLGHVGLTPTQSSALVFWTLSGLASSAEAESFLCLMWQFKAQSLVQPVVYIFFYYSRGPQATPPPRIYSGRAHLNKSSITVNPPRTSYHQKTYGDNRDSEEPQAVPAVQQALPHASLQDNPTGHQGQMSSDMFIYLKIRWKALVYNIFCSFSYSIKCKFAMTFTRREVIVLFSVLKIPKRNVSTIQIYHFGFTFSQNDSASTLRCPKAVFLKKNKPVGKHFLHSSRLDLASCSSVFAAVLTWIICTYATLSSWAATLWNSSMQVSGLVNGMILLAEQMGHSANNTAKGSFWMKYLFVKQHSFRSIRTSHNFHLNLENNLVNIW